MAVQLKYRYSNQGVSEWRTSPCSASAVSRVRERRISLDQLTDVKKQNLVMLAMWDVSDRSESKYTPRSLTERTTVTGLIDHDSSNELWFHRTWLEKAWRSQTGQFSLHWIQAQSTRRHPTFQLGNTVRKSQNWRSSMHCLSIYPYRFEDRLRIYVNPDHVFQQFEFNESENSSIESENSSIGAWCGADLADAVHGFWDYTG